MPFSFAALAGAAVPHRRAADMPMPNATSSRATDEHRASVCGVSRALRAFTGDLPGFGTTLKLRLSIIITVLLALVTVAGGGYVIRKARDDIRAEVQSTIVLTGHFLDAQLAVLRDRWSIGGYSAPLFQLRELGDVRHLRVKFYDSRWRL